PRMVLPRMIFLGLSPSIDVIKKSFPTAVGFGPVSNPAEAVWLRSICIIGESAGERRSVRIDRERGPAHAPPRRILCHRRQLFSHEAKLTGRTLLCENGCTDAPGEALIVVLLRYPARSRIALGQSPSIDA